MVSGCYNEDIRLAVIKIEILSFFMSNPHARDNLQGFSRHLSIAAALINSAMKELFEIGIVDKIRAREKAIYRLKVSYATFN